MTGRPRLRVETDPESITELRRLVENGDLPSVFLMGESLVRVEKSPTPAKSGDVTLPMRASLLVPPLFQRLIAQHVDAQRKIKGGWAPYIPSVEQIRAATSGSDWEDVPVLRGLIGTPVLRPDWTLLQDPGYDRATGLFLSPAFDMQRIPERPSHQETESARAFLLGELLTDFPWSGPSDRANMMGALLTPYVRVAFGAQTSPLLMLTASAPSSGKTNLASLIGMLVGQQQVSWPSGQSAETDLEKLISSTFTMSGGSVIFDNLDNGEVVASATLARLLTAGVWSGRILGTTGMGSWPNDREWIVTGNNLRLGGDIPSRAIVVRLEPEEEHPEERTGFKIPNLEMELTRPVFRARVLRALLVLILDWVNEGGARPDRTVTPMRSWTSLVQGVGGILTHHQITGYLGNVGDLRESDEESTRWSIFYARWLRMHGEQPVTAKQLFDSGQYLSKGEWRVADPWDGMFITGPSGRPPNSALQLGTWLNTEKGRWRGGYRVHGDRDRDKITWWRVQHAVSPPEGPGSPPETPPNAVPAPADRRNYPHYPQLPAFLA